MSDHMQGMPPGMGGASLFGAAEVPESGAFHAGSPLEAGEQVAERERVVEAVSSVYDPEIPVNIYELGLIYDIDIKENGNVKLWMTLTAPACPVAGTLPQQVADVVSYLEGTGEVEVELVWDPPWSPDRMSEDAKLALGLI